jgi:hypothetical protein
MGEIERRMAVVSALGFTDMILEVPDPVTSWEVPFTSAKVTEVGGVWCPTRIRCKRK